MDGGGAGSLAIQHPLHFGITPAGDPVQMAVGDMVNYNTLLTGMSGSGKTHGIKNLVAQYNRRGVTVLAIDTQGDLIDMVRDVPDLPIQHLPFNYDPNGGFVLNPFRIGGTKHGSEKQTVDDCIDVMRIMKAEMGSRQAATAHALILEMFEEHGIMMNRPDTWPTPDADHPGWIELLAHLEKRLDSTRKSGSINVSRAIDKAFNRLILDNEYIDVLATVRRGIDAGVVRKDPPEDPKVSTQTLIERAAREWRAMALQAADEPLFSDVSRLESLHDTVKHAVSSGVFSGREAKLANGAINIFDLSDVQGRMQRVLIRLILRRAYTQTVRTCTQLNMPFPRLVVVVDEIKHAVAASSVGDINWLERLSSEGRKYGAGIIAGAQHFNQVPSELTSNFATAILMKIEATEWDKAAKIMRVQKPMIENLAPKRDGLIKFNESDSLMCQMFAS